MNTPTTPTPELESLHKAVQEFQSNLRRVPFSNLKPLHDSIAMLRAKGASYETIAELLKQNGVNASRARVAEYGRIVLDGGKRRKRRKRACAAPAAIQAVPPAPLPQISAADSLPASSNPTRGPHIAKVELLPPGETI